MSADASPNAGRPVAVFRADLAQSLRALRKDPRLPTLTLILVLLQYIPSIFSVDVQTVANWVVLPVSIFYVGYVGAERIWFARLFHGADMPARSIWTWAWHLWPRFFGLGLLMMLLFLPLIIPIIIESVQIGREYAEEIQRTGVVPQQDPQEIAERFLTPTLVILGLVLSLLMDFALTFTTPLLALNDIGPMQALKANLRIIRQHMPASLLYVLIPPLAALLTIRAVSVTALGTPLYLGLATVGALVTLWFKGATLAFYLRTVPEETESETA